LDGRIVEYSEEWLRVIIHRSNTVGSVRVVVWRRSNPGTTPLQSPKVRGVRPAPPRDGGLFSGISLVDANECDAITGRRLHRCRQRADPDPVLLVRGRHVQDQQVAQQVHRCINLRTLLPRVAVVPGPRATFGCASQGTAIQDYRR